MADEMTKLEGVVDTRKLNDTPLWNGGGMTLDDVRRSHPPIAPLLEKWQREAVEHAAKLYQREDGLPEAEARQRATKEFGPGAKITGVDLDPGAHSLPPEWGGVEEGVPRWERSYRTRNDDFIDMGEMLRRMLEEPWPQENPLDPDEKRDLDDLLEDHQYDEKGKRLGPMSSLEGLDPLLSSIYRRHMTPAIGIG